MRTASTLVCAIDAAMGRHGGVTSQCLVWNSVSMRHRVHSDIGLFGRPSTSVRVQRGDADEHQYTPTLIGYGREWRQRKHEFDHSSVHEHLWWLHCAGWAEEEIHTVRTRHATASSRGRRRATIIQ